jgi:hypothetical protein
LFDLFASDVLALGWETTTCCMPQQPLGRNRPLPFGGVLRLMVLPRRLPLVWVAKSTLCRITRACSASTVDGIAPQIPLKPVLPTNGRGEPVRGDVERGAISEIRDSLTLIRSMVECRSGELRWTGRPSVHVKPRLRKMSMTICDTGTRTCPQVGESRA